MNNNNNENSSLSITTSTTLPRARSAIFSANDSSIMNRLTSTRLTGTLSTDDDDPPVILPIGALTSSYTSHICANNSDMVFNDQQRKQSNPRLKTTSCNFRESHNRHQLKAADTVNLPANDQHRASSATYGSSPSPSTIGWANEFIDYLRGL
uniref:Uncharacterized protein n=1 Tax=Meloidogyne hapla TaxID=6305 RepID=A0A1I8BHB2_MELHA